MGEASRGARGFSIFVGNITFDTNQEDLYKIFTKYGIIMDVFTPWAKNLNRHKGCAFIKFMYAADTYTAIGVLNRRMVDVRKLAVEMAKPTKTLKPILPSNHACDESQVPYSLFPRHQPSPLNADTPPGLAPSQEQPPLPA
ncbi:serine/arginine-rich splicing factor SC35-like [Magnolia sinica]|uniref:serine/arginine-rich splicing factor SC35-like n=1 Tax=Magnolia sinica TaxID=86752 RepID=UPI0026591A34|nr:serine/arginine-rich splicing factor SC35-like [Magnolia sinica]